MAEWIPRVGASHVGLHHRLILVVPVLSKTALFSLDLTKLNRSQHNKDGCGSSGRFDFVVEVANKVIKEAVDEDVKEEVHEEHFPSLTKTKS